MKIDFALNNIAQLRNSLNSLTGPDKNAGEITKNREPLLTKPPGSLGRLEDIAQWLATWQGHHPPAANNISVRVFAGNHGVAALGVSAYPSDVTSQMVANFKAGGAAINQLCNLAGAELQVLAIDLDHPTCDFTKEPAMNEKDFLNAFQKGIESVPNQADLLCVGEMGIGNTTSAAAICLSLFGGDAADWTGPGTGATGETYEIKVNAVANAVSRHKPHIVDGMAALQRLGGRELAAIAGAIIGARIKRTPVILDGFVAGAAASALKYSHAGAIDHCIAGHVSAEPGHKLLLEKLSMVPLLNLNMRLGEASGATLAVSIIKAAASCHNGMATFDEAGVSNKISNATEHE